MTLTLADTRRWLDTWGLDADAQGFSRRYQDSFRSTLGLFLAHLEAGDLPFDASGLRSFLAACSRADRRPRTLATYYVRIRTFGRFLASEGAIDDDPFARVPEPKVPEDQIQPLSPSQSRSLLDAARRTSSREHLLVALMLDTGMRVGEVIRLEVGHLSPPDRSIRVLGKGNKLRTVYYGRAVGRLLTRYLREEGLGDGDRVFRARRGAYTAVSLTRTHVHAIVQDLGRRAGLRGVRCSPHTLRHTFAVEFLRGGGSVFALQRLLGHTTLKMTNRYVALAQSDLAREHRHASPADRLGVS